MTATNLKAHRGINNKIVFRALGPDRVPYDITCGQEVYARIFDTENNKIVLEKLCTLGPAKGIISFELNGGDLANIHSGLYKLVLIRTEEFIADVPDYYIEKPMFVDFDDNVAMTLEITDQAQHDPKQSVIILEKDWTPDLFMPHTGRPIPRYYSRRIPGSKILNHVDALHSFSVYTENFTGVLEIFGSLEEAPSPGIGDERWFKIYPTSMSQDIEYFGYTGTTAWTFGANFLWIKFRYTPSMEIKDPGKIVKLIVRT